MRVQTLVTSQVVKEPKQDLNVLPVSNHLVCAVISRTGGADRDRTGDPLLAKQVLSQLSYSPVNGAPTRVGLFILDAGALCGRLGMG